MGQGDTPGAAGGGGERMGSVSSTTHFTTLLCLFPSLRPGMDKEVLGILVSYKVKVNLVVSRGG